MTFDLFFRSVWGHAGVMGLQDSGHLSVGGSLHHNFEGLDIHQGSDMRRVSPYDPLKSPGISVSGSNGDFQQWGGGGDGAEGPSSGFGSHSNSSEGWGPLRPR